MLEIINQQALHLVIKDMVAEEVNRKTSILQSEIELLKNNDKKVLTVEEAADYMGLSVRTIRELISKKVLPCSKVGKRNYIRTVDLTGYLLSAWHASDEEANHDVAKYNAERIFKRKKTAAKN